MERLLLFKKTITDILTLIHYPHEEIEKYSDTLLQHTLSHAFLDAAEEITEEDQKYLEKILHEQHSSREAMSTLTTFLDTHAYRKIIERNLQEQLIQFGNSVAENVLEPEKRAIMSLVDSYCTAFAN